MRILIFTTSNLVVSSGSGIRARLIAEGLQAHGGCVGIVSPSIPADFAEQGILGYPVLQGQGWHELLSNAVDDFRPDVLMGVTEGLADVVASVAQTRRVPFVYDLHGLGVVEILELGHGHGPRFERMKNSLRWLSCVPRADAVLVANPTLVPIVKLLNIRSYPIVGITDISRFSPDGPIHENEKGGTGLNVLYAGNYLKWQGVDLLLMAIKKVQQQEERFNFTLLGSMGKSSSCSDILKSNDLMPDTITFADHVPYKDVPAYYRGADILVVPRPFMLSTYLAFPQKLVDYMASGKMIVATDLAPHRYALKSSGSGILCPVSYDGLVKGFMRAKDPELRALCSRNARKVAVESFCHLAQTERIYSILQRVVDASKK